MPNWCQNIATISHENIESIDAIENELNKEKDDVGLFQMLHPRPQDEEENWYSWNVNNWGTKWDASIYDFERIDENSIRINFDTAWGPCINLYEILSGQGYEVEGFYNEEGMAFCGCYRDGWNDEYNYSEMKSWEMQEQIPSDIDDMFSLSERKQEWESENEEDEEEDEDDSELGLSANFQFDENQKSEWFDSKVKPTHLGDYEIKTEAWPFPQLATWNGKKWFTMGMETKPSEWRGLNQATHDILEEIAQMRETLAELQV